MTSIFVAKLDFGVTNEQLRELFAQYGKVLKASVATDRETGKSRGFGFVEMANEGDVQNAIRSLDGYKINGRPITVKQAEARENRSPSGNNTNGSRRDIDFKPRNNEFRRENNTPKREGFTPPLPTVEIPLIDPRKKVSKEKDKKTLDEENRNKKPKLNPYKKSGKNNKFFDDEDLFDDDDDELLNYKKKDDNDFFDDEEDDEDY
jgi:RNA recognition motif-containing protein